MNSYSFASFSGLSPLGEMMNVLSATTFGAMAAELRLHTHTICQIAYLVRSSVFRLEYASYQSLAVNSIIRSGKKESQSIRTYSWNDPFNRTCWVCVIFSKKNQRQIINELHLKRQEKLSSKKSFAFMEHIFEVS